MFKWLKDLGLNRRLFVYGFILNIIVAVIFFYLGILYQDYRSSDLSRNLYVAPKEYTMKCSPGYFEDFILKIGNNANVPAYGIFVYFDSDVDVVFNISIIEKQPIPIINSSEVATLNDFIKGNSFIIINYVNNDKELVLYSLDPHETKSLNVRIEPVKCWANQTTFKFSIRKYGKNPKDYISTSQRDLNIKVPLR